MKLHYNLQVANVHCMLQNLRALVSPSISQKERSLCQSRMNKCGLLNQLCTILMATGIPADVLTECINTVADVIRGHPENQVCLQSTLKMIVMGSALITLDLISENSGPH